MSVFELAQSLRPQLPQFAGRLPRFEAPDFIVRLFGLIDPQVRNNTHELGNVRRIDGSSGRSLLGRPMIPAADAALATARSLIAHGLVR